MLIQMPVSIREAITHYIFSYTTVCMQVTKKKHVTLSM